MSMVPPILVTGCARSGTSLTAGILDICGGFGGRMTGETPWNRKGQYENSEIRDKMVKPYMQLNNADPLGQNPLPDVHKLVGVTNWREKVESTMVWGGYEEGPWYYKGAKMCLIWPLWVDAFPDAKWVIVRRKDEDIAYSCLRTAFMRAYKDLGGWLGWVAHHKARFLEMQRACKNVREIWPHNFMHGDLDGLPDLITWLGLTWREGAVKEFITPELWRTGDGTRNSRRS